MSETIESTQVESGPAPKRLTYNEIEKRLKRTPQEIWLRLLKNRFGHTAMTYEDWITSIDNLGREEV